jgi:hypothetical protein
MEQFHRGGSRVKPLNVRPITDVVVAENLIRSLTQAASFVASSARAFPSSARV